ncbi:TerB family tellurite resistance protein [Frigidibacter oleivorans]|uniref:TerB family tellurite resistance protein n=1 Tax=Frigidibacter oleivorans TaxID=2487129 RepID=UPI000F8CED28|nr:TerB family tellurite resistance protein [Frigidibacter oleivorans]
MFGLLKKKSEEAVRKMSGRTDFLEAVCAAAALVAAADGEIEDGEIAATIKAVGANKALSSAFDQKTIESTMERMLQRAGGGRVGRSGLWTEIEDVLKDADMANAVVLTALDVAEGDGEIEPAEKVVLERLAKIASVDLNRLMAA